MTVTELRSLLRGIPGHCEVVISGTEALRPVPIASGCEMTANQCAWNGVETSGRIAVLWVDPPPVPTPEVE